MIRLVTGLPGSGKSYFAVNEIISLNYTFDKDYFRYFPKSDIVIFTNIENLKLDSVNIDSYLKEKNISITQFFNVDYQQKLVDKYKKIVYLIDEAQKFFPKKFYNPDVFFFFQYHRHFGIDIYLITQDSYLLPSAITTLVEYEIKAVRQTNRFANIFRYHFVASGDVIAKKSIRSNRLIFSLYTSAFNQPALKNAPNPLRKYALLFVVFAIFVVIAFKFFISSFFPSASAHSNSVKPVALVSARAGSQANNQAHLQNNNHNVKITQMSKQQYHKVFYPQKVKKFNIKPQSSYISTYTGGFWVGNTIKYINLDGQMIPVENFPYRYEADKASLRVLVWLPSSYFHSTVNIKKDKKVDNIMTDNNIDSHSQTSSSLSARRVSDYRSMPRSSVPN